MISKLKIMMVLVMVLLLGGCESSNYSSVMSIENNLPNLIQATYKKFEGWKYKDVRFKAGDIINVSVAIETNDGELEILILDPQNDPIFSVDSSIGKVDEEIKINADGTYKIKVKGNHSGSYSIEWHKE